ncbi:MAG: hypothetical protein PUF59_06785 [Lachnospiraceae bacterium]|nr:hypothetical protein [Lachnospiraceae bacterium]
MGLFWGTLLILIDLNVGAGGFRIDLVPDIIGWILISDGVENIFSRDSKRNEFLRVIHGMEVMAVIQILIGIAGVSDYQNPEFIYRLYEGLRVAKALAWIFVLGIILKEFKLLELENEKFWNASSLKKTFSFFFNHIDLCEFVASTVYLLESFVGVLCYCSAGWNQCNFIFD